MSDKTVLTLDQKLAAYKIPVPADLPEDVKTLLVTKHEDALQLQKEGRQKDKDLDDAKKIATDQEAQIKANQDRVEERALGYGEFKLDGVQYVVTGPAIRRVVDIASREMEVVTAQQIIDSPVLQKAFIKGKSGIVAPREQWQKGRQRFIVINSKNQDSEAPTVKMTM